MAEHSNDALRALSPLDGRYRGKTESLRDYFSEAALIRYRARVEAEYLVALAELGLPKGPPLPEGAAPALRRVWQDFRPEYAARVKELEAVTNHDVKALEYFLHEYIDAEVPGADAEKERLKTYAHFGLTSQDVNNTAFPLMLKDALQDVYMPLLHDAINTLETMSLDMRGQPMLARTHGQPASPTSLGKELYVFVERALNQQKTLLDAGFPAKFGGATGNFNAHYAAFPDTDWAAFADRFVSERLGLVRSRTTTQIDHYDQFSFIFDALRRVNIVWIDLCRDVWHYVSLDYFKLAIQKEEVGSSAMPHKVNPIDFENAEGNFGLANAIFGHLSEKLPVSRLQRDLTDSTALRNIGVPLGHTVVALRSLLKGLRKLAPNPAPINQDLEANWAVLAEAAQVILKREGVSDAYEQLKALTRTGKPLDSGSFHEFILGLPVERQVKDELYKLTPFNYTGDALGERRFPRLKSPRTSP